MTKRIMATMLAFSIAITSFASAPVQAADRGEIGRFILGAGALIILGNELSKHNRNNGNVTRHNNNNTYTHVKPRRKVVPSACLRHNRFDNGPRKFFGKRCLRNNMASFHRLPGHCARTVWTHNGRRNVFAARCLRKNGWVFG